MYIYFCHALKYDLCQIYIHYLQLKGQGEAPFSFAPPPVEQFPWLIDCLKLKSNSETLPLWADLWELVCFLMQIFQFSHVFYLKASPWPWQVLWILCLNGAVYNCLVLPTGYNNYQMKLGGHKVEGTLTLTSVSWKKKMKKDPSFMHLVTFLFPHWTHTELWPLQRGTYRRTITPLFSK